MKSNPIAEETIPLEKASHLLGEVYETLDDVKKVIRLIEEFPVNSKAGGNLSFSHPESSHGLFVVLEHICNLIDQSIEKVDCVSKEIYNLKQEQGQEVAHA